MLPNGKCKMQGQKTVHTLLLIQSLLYNTVSTSKSARFQRLINFQLISFRVFHKYFIVADFLADCFLFDRLYSFWLNFNVEIKMFHLKTIDFSIFLQVNISRTHWWFSPLLSFATSSCFWCRNLFLWSILWMYPWQSWNGADFFQFWRDLDEFLLSF